MPNNKESLLEEILTSSNGDSKEANDLLDFIENLASDMLDAGHTHEKSVCGTKKTTKKKVIKRTYYLRKELITLLSEAENKLKEIKHSKRFISQKRVTKSKIVNLALELLLNDFAEKGEDSFLFKRLFVKILEKD